MIVERLLKPSYRIRVLELRKFEPNEVVKGLRGKGIYVFELTRDLDAELAVESFLASSYGGYVYIIDFGEGRKFLARSTEPIKEDSWPTPKRFMARDENGLKRFIVSRTSLRERLLTELPPLVIWGAVFLGIINRAFRDNPGGSLFLVFFGFILNDLAKLVEYALIGYCEE
ncbi:hypothetical protein [Thermococcus radiotolerans]|uniref:Uncharacterized protein n=1 Tax=Thermococcus radiotolerans TaxID=187880 RepID=A0A2Z2MVX7_9EURY|nr:hypothetical protein [Thermococcus radiotolerans]ASJ14008.1 hypothetical protein A3L10_02245 [Thermococcus radiotolerans]